MSISNKLIPYLFVISYLIIFRLIPHPPNFTPVIATAILAPYLIKNKYTSCLIILFSMFISDLFLGLHQLMLFVYLPLIITILVSNYIKYLYNKYLTIFSLSILSSILFFIISNFGVWLVFEYYTKDLNGLLQCYVMAIPFFKNTVLSTLFYSVTFVIIYEIIIHMLSKKSIYKLQWLSKE
tara:strand:+ start:655 stop:1197 length:543 start_codon:yes stop_codon:yes gene_type:complete